MSEITTEVVQQALEGVGLVSGEVAILSDYSGRGMFGDECFGLVADAGEFALFCASLGSFADDWDWVGDVRSDNMGLSTVWYWPGVKLVEGATA